MYYFFLYFYLVSSKETRTFIYKLQYIWLREINPSWSETSADTKSNVRILDGKMNGHARASHGDGGRSMQQKSFLYPNYQTSLVYN